MRSRSGAFFRFQRPSCRPHTSSRGLLQTPEQLLALTAHRGAFKRGPTAMHVGGPELRPLACAPAPASRRGSKGRQGRRAAPAPAWSSSPRRTRRRNPAGGGRPPGRGRREARRQGLRRVRPDLSVGSPWRAGASPRPAVTAAERRLRRTPKTTRELAGREEDGLWPCRLGRVGWCEGPAEALLALHWCSLKAQLPGGAWWIAGCALAW